VIDHAIKTAFLKLGLAKPQDFATGCQGFRGTKMRNGGRALLAVRNLYVRIKIRVVTFDTLRFVTDCTQTIAVSVQKFPDSVVVSKKSSPWTESMCQTKWSGCRPV
jgi:hypothetical protein